ncbi:M16 family metallopeptidase [Clostridium sp. WILCCON 0269]|uniref:M16 family metallopeptidase n=1 Tax=Candidatus Clostridium eludens TaxID=3381663 RepID=A0ABW8SMN4_9CLOT
MEKYVFDNGLKLIYEYRPGKLSSICIGFNAGALEEGEQFPKGTAHALEHVISKGTEKRSECDINSEFDRLFGFENAMTNYPYTIYYGTCFSEDLNKAVELYSDIILNAAFKETGFKEEMNIILQELKEWKDNIYQHCEDVLFKNSFQYRRIKELIIGNEDSIKNITLDEIKRFYLKFYVPENCVICVCSSLEFTHVHNIIENYFAHWKTEVQENFIVHSESLEVLYEKNKKGIFIENALGVRGVRIQYIFDIHRLDRKEFEALILFNAIFGQGSGSILFNEIRTYKGLAYEVGSSIKNERGIKLFSIKMGTSVENIDKAITIVNNTIDKLKYPSIYFKKDKLSDLIKNIRLKGEIKRERSIEFCKEAVIHELMYGSCNFDEIEKLNEIKAQDVVRVVNKFMNDPSVQILKE